ncbi:carbohydrate-binding protein [Nocardia sp. NPDC051570]|uniref:carbohydrate-binding protein n=1 Tax=Nocardia sp. NPDC051570 TaxID=3364324 RepID=UPI0037975623
MGTGIIAVAVAAMVGTLPAPTASATVWATDAKPGVGGDPGVYTVSATLGGSGADDQNAQIFFYDRVWDSKSTNVMKSDILIGGGPQRPNGNTASVTWYPTMTGTHDLLIEEWTAAHGMISYGGPGVDVSQLPKTPAPIVPEPTGGSLTDKLITMSGLVHHPNESVALSVSTASVPADATVHITAGGTDLGVASIANGMATAQYTPTKVGTTTLTAVYDEPGKPRVWFAGQTWLEVTNPITPAVADWQAAGHYNAGDVVNYNGAKYRCLQAHTAQADWTPDATPALWQRI